MNKKYSIGFLIGIIFLAFAFVCIFQLSYDRAMRAREKEEKVLKKEQEYVMATDGKTYKQESYLIKEEDGYVIVYDADKKTVYEYTSILVNTLPSSVQEEVKKGKIMKDIREVYGFLENYSS